MSSPSHPSDPQREDDVLTGARPRTRTPPRYRILLHNDDFTSMEFVVEMLMHFFHQPETQATRIMLEVHHKGLGVAGVFTREVAETKVAQVTALAQQRGYPLLLTMEPE